MICPNCNAENKDDATHCSNCGEYIANNEPTEAQNTVSDRNSRLEEIQARRNKKKKRQKRNKAVFICLLIVILIALVAFGIYWVKTNFLDRTVSDNTIVVTSTPIVIDTPIPTVSVSEEPTEMPTETPTIAPTIAPTEVSATTTAPTDNLQSEAKPSTAPKTSGTASKPATQSGATKATAKPSTQKKTASKPKKTANNTTATTSIAANTVPAVLQGNPMTNQAVKGLGYVTVPSTGQPLICFKIADTKYYAYVPSYNPLGDAKGNFTVDAVNTGDVYYGLPVYSLSNIQILNASSTGGYIIPKSSSELLTEKDLAGLSKAQLKLARNEIFARHGRTFKAKELQDYFNTQSWYKVNPNYNYKNDYLNLSKTEKTNAKFILAYENK